jgi:hypothetical protein
MVAMLVGADGSAAVGVGKAFLPDGRVVWQVALHGRLVSQQLAAELTFRELPRLAPDGLVLEFGVRGGESIRELAAYGRKVYGFDWWKGLPHEWDQWSPKGSCLAERPTDLPPNVELIDGLFSDTLEGFLAAHTGPVGCVNLDCDLYCSSIYVLHCLADRFVPGSMVALSAMCLFPTCSQELVWKRYLAETGQLWNMAGKQHAWGEVWRKS